MAKAKQSAPAQPSSRWFRVIGERFDWIIKPGLMKSFQRGQIAYEPQACIDAGLSGGLIEVIDRPEGAKVGKDGSVILGN